MCFYHDYDWYASITEESELPADGKQKCNECGRIIEGMAYHLFQQEHEECQSSHWSEADDEDLDECNCETPDFGETCTYDCCQDCRKFLQAVEAAEHAAGCDREESRPALFCMIEEICEGGDHEARKYFKQANQQFPELRRSGYLGQLWKRMFQGAMRG